MDIRFKFPLLELPSPLKLFLRWLNYRVATNSTLSGFLSSLVFSWGKANMDCVPLLHPQQPGAILITIALIWFAACSDWSPRTCLLLSACWYWNQTYIQHIGQVMKVYMTLLVQKKNIFFILACSDAIASVHVRDAVL